MSKIIVAAPPVPGELSPLLSIARGLAGRGHHIRVVTGSGFRAQVEDAGLAFIPVSGEADIDAGVVHGSPERAKLAPGPEMLSYDLIHMFLNPMPALHAVLQRLLEQ